LGCLAPLSHPSSLHNLLTTTTRNASSQLRQLDAWYRSEVDRWTAERDELVRKGTQLEQRHAQFVHELRRRDAEFERLQGKLRALLK